MISLTPVAASAWQKTRNLMRQKMITWNFADHQTTFFPNDVLTEMCEKINEHCTPLYQTPSPFRRHRQKIRGTHTKVFLIGIYINISVESLINILSSANLNDQALPFDQSRFDNAHQAGRPQVASAQEITNFIREQSKFFPVMFSKGGFSRKISDGASIPIRGSMNSSEIAEGATGKVFTAQISQQPANFSPSSTVAIKQIDDFEEAQREIVVLRRLAGTGVMPHTNIAQIYCGFQFHGKYFLIAERAKGNLVDLMKESSKFNPTRQWLQGQFRDLAAALNVLHGGVRGHVVWHHDIKPANILGFSSKGTVNLKITDWVSASTNVYTSADSPKSTPVANPRYLAPEADDDQQSSRPHDAWSLGCVFVELLIWEAAGASGRAELLEALDKSEDGYWEYDPHADPAQKLIGYVMKALTELEDGYWNDTVKIIKGMLEVNPLRRITARHLAKELKDLC